MEDNKTNLTKEQAIQAMREGKKARHRYFTDDEWITIQDGNIVAEDGCKFKPLEFWQTRNNGLWEDGYSIVSEKSEDNKTKEVVSAEQYRKDSLTGRLYDSTHFDVTDTVDIMLEEYAVMRVEKSTKLLLEEKKLDHEEVIKQRDAITELSKKLFTADQSTKHLQDRVKELEKEARQMIYKFMLSDEMANRPDGEHIIETIEKWFLNTKS